MALLDQYPSRTSEPDLSKIWVRMVGTGATAPTKVYGRGVTIARTGVGVYTLTFATSPGTYAGYTWGIDATTAANIKNHDVVLTATSSTVLTLTFWDAAAAAHDLVATEFINLELAFIKAA
jgi:hypothetical protein